VRTISSLNLINSIIGYSQLVTKIEQKVNSCAKIYVQPVEYRILEPGKKKSEKIDAHTPLTTP
jgi:hypothetical protein